jgi:3-deoxy-manno-octulosonate cytidylyltransferase (CMP-KDO synthetase)
MNKNGFHIIIPARYNSTRLPGKALLDLGGKTVIERVYHQALQAGALSVTIATDHAEINAAARDFGANVVMTDSTHESGTDRIAQAAALLGLKSTDLIVNVQGDEPFISPLLIQQVAEILTHSATNMATLCWPITDQEMLINPNIVKVVRDQHNHALYFSRSNIPFNRDDTTSLHNIYRHIGLYAYRASFLFELVKLPVCKLEAIEALEQLRVLWSGNKIHVEEACVMPLQDLNTMDDLFAARKYLENNTVFY